VALTEAFEDDAPDLITHVEAVAAPIADGALTPRIHRALKAEGLLPAVHLVDTGFLDAELLVDSRADDGVEVLGPTRGSAPPSWTRGRPARPPEGYRAGGAAARVANRPRRDGERGP
jgi:hypothetical protein